MAALAGWMILKGPPGFPVMSPAEAEGPSGPSITPEERTTTYARWFVAMRWIAVGLAAVLVFISVRIVGWLPQKLGWPLGLTVAALAAVNLLYTILIRWDRGVRLLLPVQAYLDLLILTVLLHFSGGIENPLSMMMLFHVIIAGILLSRRQCYLIAATASLLFALLALAEWTNLIEHYTLQLYPHSEHEGQTFHPAHHALYVVSSSVLQAVVLFLTAYFVTTLAERIRQNELRLQTMAERTLADQQLLERALETTGTALRVLGRDSRSYWVNTRWNEWFVCAPGVNCQACDLLNGEHSPSRQSLRDGQTRVTELAYGTRPHASGLPQAVPNSRVFQVTTAPLLDRNGHLSQIVELAQDITQQKQTQAQMIRAGKLAAVGELAGKVAHEVNNPIAVISAKAQLLLSDHRIEIPRRIAQELGKIGDLANRVARIAQGLLSYCRPSPATRLALDIRVPIRKSLAIVEQHARSAGVRIEDDLPGSMPLVKANTHELEQVFLNLFLNALDAMPNGGCLRVSARPGQSPSPESPVAVVVEDTGAGIPETIRERIFEPFFTTKHDGRGTGLGLSICLGLVRSHGGEIELDSAAGQGARFIVKLPVNVQDRNEGG